MTCSRSSPGNGRSATPRSYSPDGSGRTSRYCRCTRGSRPPISRRSSGRSRTHKRRVVLATNVAETSLTVPGIRCVVDTGIARISRYSARLKVQRLPVEPISRASADQRKGRCGRLADGICVRLYSEDDFNARPEFTDPEVLRTNLASVILWMAALGLGEIEAFPFLEPPDRRQVRDGVALLHELRALDPSAAGAAHTARSQPRAAPDRPTPGSHGAGGRQARLRPRGGRHRRRAVDPGSTRAPRRAARPGRPAPRPLHGSVVGLPGLREPVALPALAGRRALALAGPQALQGRVSALPAHPRVAGPRRPARGRGARGRGDAQRRARRGGGDPRRPRVRAALAPGNEGRPNPRVHRRARRQVRDLPRLGARAPRADVGDGRRARRDDAAVGQDSGGGRYQAGRAARRAPRQALLRRAAVGSTPRRRRRVRAGDVVRPGDRRVAHRPVRADRPGGRARAVHPPRARRGRLGPAPRVHATRTSAAWRRSRRSRRGRDGATCSPARRCERRSSTRGSRRTSSAGVISTAGGSRRGRPSRRCSTTRWTC